MNSRNSWTIGKIVALAAFLFFAPLASRADSFSIVGNWAERTWGFQGIDQNGYVYLENFHSILYQTEILSPTGSSVIVNSNSPLTVVSDRGSSCQESLSGFNHVLSGICNGGRFAFLYDANGDPNTSLYTYDGTGTAQFVTTDAHGDLLAMNGLGDIVFDDGFNDIGYYAVNLTTLSAVTPEPSSFLLLVTGTIALAGFDGFRRKSLS